MRKVSRHAPPLSFPELFFKMSEEDAFNYVALYVEPRRDPVILESEISVILSSHKRGELAWDLDWAILDCWKLKMGRASDYYDVDVGGRAHSSGAVFEHCKAMVQLWERRANVSIELDADGLTGDFLVVANYNDPLKP
jgi:hypothetical protein